MELPSICGINQADNVGAPEVFYKYQNGKSEIPVVISLCNTKNFDTVLYLFESKDCDVNTNSCTNNAAVDCSDGTIQISRVFFFS